MSPPGKDNKKDGKLPAKGKKSCSKQGEDEFNVDLADDDGKNAAAEEILTQKEDVLSEVDEPVSETLLETPKKKVVPSLFALSKSRAKVSPESRGNTVSTMSIFFQH